VKHKGLMVLLLLSSACLLLLLCFLPFSKQRADAEDTLTQIPLQEAEYSGTLVTPGDPYELYYLYDFLYIGDSFIVRLADSGILHESCTVLAKSGTSAKDWYVKEDNERYVNFLEQLHQLSGTSFRGIIMNYGINYVMGKKNVSYMEDLIDDIHDTFPETPLFVLKIMPVAEYFVLEREGKEPYTSEEINHGKKQSVVHYNEAVEQYCHRKENVFFVDPTEGFVDDAGNLKREYADERGLHIASAKIPDWCQNIFQAVTTR